MQETALRTMARILGFKSVACQESALQGLGHWQRDHDRQVNAIVDGFPQLRHPAAFTGLVRLR
jgi:hypothetical protein